MNAQNLKDNIKAIHALPIKGGFRVELEFTDGKREVIKKKGVRAPSTVQLYSAGYVNGNNRGSTAGHFLFAKKIDSTYRCLHLKTYSVEVG